MLVQVANILLFFCYSVNAVPNDRYYPRYHLAPTKGWMNDPNGFCIYKDEYHLFYQYNPNSSLVPGIAHWAHAKSKDLFHWEDVGIAMYPDQWYDQSGVFSGSAIVENGSMYLFYTGNINRPGETPDHQQQQALAVSNDGVKVVKYAGNPIINGSKIEPNTRDPKVWKYGNTYYMVLGNSFKNDTLGRALLYASKDKINWEQVSVLAESTGPEGFMWECPDFFELNGYYVLLFSPQGIKPQGDKYRNLFQTGYIIGEFDYSTHVFTPLTSFKELDSGHDFYATQTILNNIGERVMVGWADMWETNYPEQGDGFTGQMTIPRVLSLSRNGTILQKPVREISTIRGHLLYAGMTRGNTAINLTDNAAEVIVRAPAYKNFELYLESSNKSRTVTLSYNARKGQVSLNRQGNDGLRRTKWRPIGLSLNWQIFIDASSIELFCGKGEVTFTSRFFPDGPVQVRVGKNSRTDMLKVTSVRRTLYLNHN